MRVFGHEKLTGKSRAETLGRNVWEAFPEEADRASKYWTELRRCMEERVPVQFVERYAPLERWTDVRA